MIQIYRNIAGVETGICSVPDKNTTYKSAIMGVELVRINFIVDSEQDIQADDYIKYEGIDYTLNRDDEFTKKSDVEYEYNLIFEHPIYRLLDKMIALSTTGSMDFTLTGKLIDFMTLVVWNMNYDVVANPLGVDTGWTAGSAVDTPYKSLTFSSTSCRDVLTMLSEAYNVEFYLTNKQINFVTRIENPTALTFIQGQGLGLYEVSKLNVDKGDTITRIYPVGANKNVPNANADEQGYLKLPEVYLQNTSEISRIVERRVVFDTVFPHFLGSVETVSGTNNIELICTAIDFDLNAIAIGNNARINFLTGDLMGCAFEFQFDYALTKITLIEQQDETALADAEGIKPMIPNATRKAVLNDEFNFTGVNMPESYVTAAITSLRALATDWMAFYSRKRIKFEVQIDHRFMRGKSELHVGDTITISIPQKNITALLRIASLEKNLYTGKLTATVSNYLEEKWRKKIEGSISSLSQSVNSEIIKAVTLQARLEAAKYITQAIGGSTEFIGGLELVNLLLMKGLDGIVRGGLSGLYGDKVGLFTGGTYEQAQEETCDVLFKKDGTGGQLAGGNIKWDGVGNTNFKGIIEALGGKIGGLSLFMDPYPTLASGSMEFSESAIDTLESLISPTSNIELVNNPGASGYDWASNGYGYSESNTQEFTVESSSKVVFACQTNYANTPRSVKIINSAGTVVYENSTFPGGVRTVLTAYIPIGTFHIQLTNTSSPTTHLFTTITGSPLLDTIVISSFTAKTKIGNNGLFSFWGAANYLYYSALAGLEYKGPMNIPGVLAAGTCDSAGALTNSWGAKVGITGAVKQETGIYTVNHMVGNTEYTVLVTAATSNCLIAVDGKTNTSFTVTFYKNSDGTHQDAGFDYVIIGHN